MPARGDAHRMIRWLWTSRRLDARLARAALIPASGVYWAVMAVRALAYRAGVLPSHPLPLPSVAVGNLTVGGSGKTPVAIWIAQYYAAHGIVPGVLLRGYGGGDEALVHQRAVPEARVVVNPDRVAGGAQASRDGAQVLVLDDAYQRLDTRRDLNVIVLSAETTRAVRWPLPAGPWRETWRAVGRADLAIVTRKRASAEAAAQLAEEVRAEAGLPVMVAHLGLRSFEGLLSGMPQPPDLLAGKRVVAASAIADPDAFIAQTKATGAAVQAATWRDHHEYRDEDVAWLAHAARRADYVVVTEKDAVKLRDRWPANTPEPLVANLDLAWESDPDDLTRRLDALVAHTARRLP